MSNLSKGAPNVHTRSVVESGPQDGASPRHVNESRLVHWEAAGIRGNIDALIGVLGHRVPDQPLLQLRRFPSCRPVRPDLFIQSVDSFWLL